MFAENLKTFIMKTDNFISVKDFSKLADLTTQHVYHLGKTGKIEIQEVAGYKVIDIKKYPPEKFKKKT